MIIQTRYRDIDQPEHATHSDWNAFRGKPLNIEVPAGNPTFVHAQYCQTGPFFRVVGAKHPVFGNTLWVCPHIAEIGD